MGQKCYKGMAPVYFSLLGYYDRNNTLPTQTAGGAKSKINGDNEKCRRGSLMVAHLFV